MDSEKSGDDRWWPQVSSRVRAALGTIVRGLRPAVVKDFEFDPAALERAALHPVLFTEKIFHKIVHDRDPRMIMFADKVAVRDFVADRIGPQYLTRAYLVSDSAQVDWNALPDSYVAKVAHGSGGTIIVSPHAPQDARLPTDVESARWGTFAVRRENIDPALMTALFTDWLGLDFSTTHSSVYPEWCYSGCERRILVEEYLDSGIVSPPDFKFFMVHGKCLFIQFDSDRLVGHKRDILTPQWKRLPVRLVYQRSEEAPSRPHLLPHMLRVAERLAADCDFVRVDLYAHGDRVVFGELTNYPEAGRARFQPVRFDRRMGRRWPTAQYPT